ncbi:hypothetical protein JCM13591A_19300 [Microbacterium xylanilyticum]
MFLAQLRSAEPILGAKPEQELAGLRDLLLGRVSHGFDVDLGLAGAFADPSEVVPGREALDAVAGTVIRQSREALDDPLFEAV